MYPVHDLCCERRYRLWHTSCYCRTMHTLSALCCLLAKERIEWNELLSIQSWWEVESTGWVRVGTGTQRLQSGFLVRTRYEYSLWSADCYGCIVHCPIKRNNGTSAISGFQNFLSLCICITDMLNKLSRIRIKCLNINPGP